MHPFACQKKLSFNKNGFVRMIKHEVEEKAAMPMAV